MGKYELNKNLAQMLKGGVIMDVTNADQAKIAEAAGACAVMALERVPADIRRVPSFCQHYTIFALSAQGTMLFDTGINFRTINKKRQYFSFSCQLL